ncbi:hypothetical protein [Actinomadura yumaensis]|uniref:Terminase n=1 Tax=Actinomadura yumaensis TaxID=111807 RepID=A0ABW2CNX9_9ACTN
MDADRLLDDLLVLPPRRRRPLLALLGPEDMRQLLAASTRQGGTPYALWRDDPSGFVEVVLRESVWSKQREVLDAVPKFMRVAVPAGFGLGKTWLAARAVAHHCCVHPVGTATAVTTATRMRQVHRQMWPHIRRVVAQAGLPGECDQVQWHMPDLNGVRTTVAYGFTAPEHDEAAMQGIHDEEILLVVDEAGGIGHTIGRSTRNLLTGGGAHMLAIGNPPTDMENSWFEQLCNEGLDPRDNDTITVRIAATDSPMVTGEEPSLCRGCPGRPPHSHTKDLVDQKWIDGAIKDHGPDAPYVVAKVHARFPHGGAFQILPSDWVDAAANSPEPEGPDWVPLRSLGLEGETGEELVRPGAWVRLGVDVAADGGDEFVISRAIGDLLTVRHISSGDVNASAVHVAGKVLEHVHAAERVAKALKSQARVRVKIDGIGLGWGVASLLQAWGAEGKHGADIVPVVVSESPEREADSDSWRPWRKRDEMWLAGRGLLDPGRTGRPDVRLRVDERTLAQMRGPRYSTNSAGSTVVEPKPLMRKRGLASPDRAEALLLAVYEPISKKTRRTGLYV